MSPNKSRSNGDYIYFIGFVKIFLQDPNNTITLYSSADKETERVFENLEEYDEYKFMKDRFFYKPDQRYIDENTDFVYINGGPTNLMYTDKYWGVPNISKCYMLLDTDKGLVFVSPGEVELEFAFWLEGFHPSLFNLDNKITSFDLLRDKKYIIMTRAYNKNKFLEHCNVPRAPYGDLNLSVEYFNDSSIPMFTFPDLKPKYGDELKYKCSYIGNRRRKLGQYRYKQILEYMTALPDLHIWGDLTESDFPDNPGDPHIHGKVEQRLVPEILNQSVCALIITDRQYEKDEMGLVTNRIFECIRCGTIPLIKNTIDPNHIISIPDILFFKDDIEFRQKVKYFNSISSEERSNIINGLKDAASLISNPLYYWRNFKNLYFKYKDTDLDVESKNKEGLLLKFMDENLRDQGDDDFTKVHNRIKVFEIFNKAYDKDNKYIDDFDTSTLQYNDVKCCKRCAIILEQTTGYTGRSNICKRCDGKGSIKDPEEFLFSSLEEAKGIADSMKDEFFNKFKG